MSIQDMETNSKNYDDENVNLQNISENELLNILKFYYKSFGFELRKWLLKTFSEIDEEKLDNILSQYEDDVETENCQNIYSIQDDTQMIYLLIRYSDTQPELITQQILNSIFTEEAKKKVMTFFNNSYMSIKYIIKKIEHELEINLFTSLRENAMFIYKEKTNNFFGYYITFNTVEN
jgi:hypothetical protein